MNSASRFLNYKIAWIGMIVSFVLGMIISIPSKHISIQGFELYLLYSPLSTLFSIYTYLVTRKLIVTDKGFKHMNIFYIIFIAITVFDRLNFHFDLTGNYFDLPNGWRAYGIIFFRILYGILFLQLSTTLFNRKKAYAISFLLLEIIQLINQYFTSFFSGNNNSVPFYLRPEIIIGGIAVILTLVNYFILIQIFYRAAKEAKNDHNQPFQELIDKIGEEKSPL